jgi:hypothetical protein
MRRSIRCQPPHADEDHHDFANFQAFMSPTTLQKQPPPKYTYATTTTTMTTPSKLTFGNPLQFVPSASHAAAHQHRGAKMSPDNAFRPPQPQQQHYNSPTNNKTPASPATSGSSSYVAWPSISPEQELVLHESFTMHRQQQQFPVKPQDTSRQTALTTSMASSFDDDDEEEEIPSWEEFHHGAAAVVTAPRPTSWSATQYQQRAAAGATSRRPVPSLRVARSVQQPSALPSLRSTMTTTAPTARSVQQQEEDFDHYPDPDISVGMHNSDEEEEEPPQQRPAEYQQTHQHHHYRGAPAPRLSHDALRYKESLEPTMLYPTPALAKGFCGLFDKTKAVPCLLDDTEESTTLDEDSDHNTSHRHNDDSPRIFRELHNSRNNDAEALSDVFDGIIISDPPNNNNRSSNNLSADRLYENRSPSPHRQSFPQQVQPQAVETIPKAFAMVRLKGGLSAIQTTPDMFRNRTTKSSSVISDNSTDDDGGSTGTDGSSIPDHHTMVSAGRRLHDNAVYGIHTNILSNVQRCPKPNGTTTAATTTTSSSSSYHHHQRTNKTHHAHSSPYDESSDNDGEYNDHCGYWYQYRVDPACTAALVRTYRELSAQVSTARLLSGDTGYEYEWEDDERKLFALSEMRSRIMEKDLERGLERRGGTLATDDLVTTSYHRTPHRIRDALIVSKAWRDGATVSDVIRTEQLTRKHLVHSVRRANQQLAVISYEPVAWRDDTDFHQYRCPSLSGRQMRGGEMFTIGDCQSILLKLTNDRCMVRFFIPVVLLCDCFA